ncbi:hypothetical protein V8C43DRAFT_277981 [Trichoderma afarasin]
MEDLSRAELAQRAAQDVAVVASKLGKKKPISLFKRESKQRAKNLNILATSLQSISFGQNKYGPEEHVDQQDIGVIKLEKFLQGLELVCTYPDDYLSKTEGEKAPVHRFPTLKIVVTAYSLQTPLSALDIETLYKIEKSVESFVLERPKITGPYFKFLKSFVEVKDQAKKHAESAQRDARKTKLDEDENYPRHVYDTLYRAINKYAECCCGLPNSTPRKHWGRLELKANFGTTNNEILFHTVFSKKGLRLSEYDEQIEWQHLQLRVPRKQLEVRAVRSGDDICQEEEETRKDNITNATKPGDTTEVISPSDFCKLLGKDIGSGSMDIRIKDEALLVLKRAVDIEVDIADGKSISLADVLGNGSLVPKLKLILAYILAKSVWQFYDSDFMNIRWTTRSIQLFREKEDEDDDNEPGVDWAPYYDFSSVPMAAEDSKEQLPPGQFLHRYPRVLALGAILYELGQKKRGQKPTKASALRSPTDPTNPPTIEKRVNDAVSKIRKRVQNKGWPDIGLKDIQVMEDYRAIVANCVSKDLFKLDLKETPPNSWSQYFLGTTEELEEVLTVSERRAIIFKKIVAPLKEMVQSAGLADQLGNIQRSQVAGEIARLKEEILVSEEPESVAALNDTTLVSQVSPCGTQDGQTASESEAEVWLNQIKGTQVMEDVVSAFQKKKLTTNRIRIVVLDTGYDPDAVFFLNRDRKRRIFWKDFVEENQPEAKDENGHGTHILSVLMKVAPAADVFMARVARDTQDLPNATENIAAAIEWAWKKCKADIVNMSFGFDEEILVNDKRIISNAINGALEGTDQHILFFAAAANHGGNEEEMFPASNPNVFSIRGCDVLGCALGFNPPLGRNANIYFMTLGLDIPGPSLAKSKDGGADVYKSGTSVATPIAAGIAAILLGYTRIHEEQLQQRLGNDGKAKLSRLWKISGMTELFKKMLPETEEKLVYLNLHRFIDYSHETRLAKIQSAITDTRS